MRGVASSVPINGRRDRKRDGALSSRRRRVTLTPAGWGRGRDARCRRHARAPVCIALPTNGNLTPATARYSSDPLTVDANARPALYFLLSPRLRGDTRPPSPWTLARIPAYATLPSSSRRGDPQGAPRPSRSSLFPLPSPHPHPPPRRPKDLITV